VSLPRSLQLAANAAQWHTLRYWFTCVLPPTCATVYPDGKVCISILHSAGVDRYNTLVRIGVRTPICCTRFSASGCGGHHACIDFATALHRRACQADGAAALWRLRGAAHTFALWRTAGRFRQLPTCECTGRGS
jgi:hypothetical protein